MSFIAVLKQFSRFFGFDIIRYHNLGIGDNPYKDCMFFLDAFPLPVAFDVGANLGESADSIRKYISPSVIHCFEPNPFSFNILKTNLQGTRDVNLWDLALGSKCADESLILNQYPHMSSILAPSAFSYGEVTGRHPIELVSLDYFCSFHGIKHIHFLKIDTQGFELEVLKGSAQMFLDSCISLVLVELIFSDMYKNIPSPLEVASFLQDNNFIFAGLYRQHFQSNLISWADALFVHKSLAKS